MSCPKCLRCRGAKQWVHIAVQRCGSGPWFRIEALRGTTTVPSHYIVQQRSTVVSICGTVRCNGTVCGCGPMRRSCSTVLHRDVLPPSCPVHLTLLMLPFSSSGIHAGSFVECSVPCELLMILKLFVSFSSWEPRETYLAGNGRTKFASCPMTNFARHLDAS
jgi:hypothetical protein